MDLGISGRCAIVTGASKGIGRATAAALADEGASVVLVARNPEPLAAVARELEGASGMLAVEADVMDRSSADHIRDAALERFGRIDIVVNNAGSGGSPLASFDEDEWHDLYTMNVTSGMRLVTACLPAMRAQKWGRIVNVGSTMSRHCDPRFGPYGASKAALLHVTRNLSQAFARDGVLANCVLPGLTRSDGVLDGYREAATAMGRTSDDVERRMLERQPIAIGRTGEPEEVAAMIAFLCSERASWVTGAEILVDGGTITDI
jgi:3-oxoacyl-[acyl-carrier protein] reductase